MGDDSNNYINKIESIVTKLYLVDNYQMDDGLFTEYVHTSNVCRM